MMIAAVAPLFAIKGFVCGIPLGYGSRSNNTLCLFYKCIVVDDIRGHYEQPLFIFWKLFSICFNYFRPFQFRVISLKSSISFL